MSEVFDLIALRKWDEAVAGLEQWTARGPNARGPNARGYWAALTVDPSFDPLRALPRFQALVDKLRADPRFSPKAGERVSAAEAPKADEKSVAVLAFANLSDDKTNEYFSDGISEELLNVLAKIPGLKVSARTSAFYFRGKEVPIPEIAKQLGVAYVVEGSVRKAGDKVRITAQLIKAADGFHVWSDTFTRELKDVFSVQDEIAGLISRQLQLKLGTTGPARAFNPEALTLLLEARYYWNQRGEQNFDRAETLLNRALAIEPTFARAHSALADVWLMRASYRLLDGGANVATELKKLGASATRASELDPTLVDPVAARAYGLMFENRMEEAGKLFADALSRSPDNPTFLYWRALYLMNQGDFHAARRDYEKSRSYDPMAFIVWHNSAECGLALGNYGEAAAFAARAHELRKGGFVQAVACEAMATWLAGRREEAVALARSTRQPEWQQLPWIKAGYAVWVLRQAGLASEASTYGEKDLRTLPVASYQRGFLLAALGRFAEAHPYLENMPPYLHYLLATSPIFDPWRDDPQFTALVKKLNWSIPYAKARATRLEALRR
jgi:TolB-like protein/Flp pilus assembly protein TadD